MMPDSYNLLSNCNAEVSGARNNQDYALLYMWFEEIVAHAPITTPWMHIGIQHKQSGMGSGEFTTGQRVPNN
jgi:hypothetical protein